MVGKRRILVVDDEPDIRSVLGMALEFSLDAQVIGVGSAKAAFEYLEANPKPDLIIMDVMMPDIDGYTACKRLRESPELKSVPVIFLTARLGSVEQEKGEAVGGTAFLAKPFDPLTIGGEVTKLLADAGYALDPDCEATTGSTK